MGSGGEGLIDQLSDPHGSMAKMLKGARQDGFAVPGQPVQRLQQVDHQNLLGEARERKPKLRPPRLKRPWRLRL